MKKLILIISFLFATTTCNAQWVHWGPWGNDVNVPILATENDHLFSSIDYLSWYDTTRHVWVTADTGINFSNNAQITCFATIGSLILAGGPYTGIYLSTNNGSTWATRENEFTGVGPGTFTTCGTAIIAGGLGDDSGVERSGIYRSIDSGASWVPAYMTNAQILTSSGSFILVGQSVGAALSTDGGNTWAETALSQESGVAAAITGTTLWIGTQAGHIRKSTDNGQTWTVAWNNDSVNKNNKGVTSFAISGTTIFAGTMRNGVLESTDSGGNWTAVTQTGLEGGVVVTINALAIYDSMLVCATNWGVAAIPLSQLLPPKSAVAEIPQPGDTIEVYPNPASGTVSILSGATSLLGVSVLNVLGEDVLDMSNLRQSDITLDVSKLPSETYFVHIETANGSVLRKVVIQH